jgi:hypothetical protein
LPSFESRRRHRGHFEGFGWGIGDCYPGCGLIVQGFREDAIFFVVGFQAKKPVITSMAAFGSTPSD